MIAGEHYDLNSLGTRNAIGVPTGQVHSNLLKSTERARWFRQFCLTTLCLELKNSVSSWQVGQSIAEVFRG